MLLKEISYSEFEGDARFWSIQGLQLGGTNLIVGKNATGKTRTLNMVNGLAALLSGRLTGIQSGTYVVDFDDNGALIKYFLSVQFGEIVAERVTIDGVDLLTRGLNGVGRIFAERLNLFIDFKIPTNILAVHGRRDTLQHNFIERFAVWADGVRAYHFGQDMGRKHFAILSADAADLNEWDENMVVGLLRRGISRYGKDYTSALISDLAKIDYHIEDISVGPPVTLPGEIPVGLVCLLVTERGVPTPIDQLVMSQGMFRVISLLIQINLFLFGGIVATLVIDDIGEGLDYDRSCKLIELLQEKCGNQVQIVMSSNDRFIMNGVPLEYWSILRRNGPVVSVDNFVNSREKFEDFKFTGLSNFSFFELDASMPSIGG